MTKRHISSLLTLLIVLTSNLLAQDFTSIVSTYRPAGSGKTVITLKPDKNDWLYSLNEEANVNIELTNTSVRNATISCEISMEQMYVMRKSTVTTVNGKAVFNAGSLSEPGFLRCTFTATIDGVVHKEIVTLGFAPHLIEPTVKMPVDFMEFWQNEISEARKIPLNYNLTLLADRSTSTTNVYQLDFENHKRDSKFYAVVSIPKKEGKYPALVRFPGAGYNPTFSGASFSASKNIIVVDVYIHEHPVTMNTAYYDNLKNTTLKNYFLDGIESRDTYYFKRVIIGCVKTIDCIFEFPEFDGENVISYGSSQGGALSTITTGLDKRIKYFTSLFTAMSDQPGYLYERAGGWPHYFRGKNIVNVNPDALHSTQYYDVVNFARFIDVPGLFSWGYNDTTTPTTSIYASYNLITSPKETLIILNGTHRVYSEQTNAHSVWLDKILANINNSTGLESQKNNNFKVFTYDNKLHILLKDLNCNIQIFNLKGQKIFSKNETNKSLSLSLSKGVYVLKVNENQQKIII